MKESDTDYALARAYHLGWAGTGLGVLGNVLVQVKKEKRLVNQKRLKLKVRARELYPEDYDFSIVFDSVENRKARHQMERKYVGNIEVRAEE